MTLTSVILALTSDGTAKTIIQNPTLKELQSADSIHVVAFTSHGDLLVAESEGSFTIQEWDEVYETGKRLCCDEVEKADDDIMQTEGLDGKAGSMKTFLRSILKEKVEADTHWKE
jgi:exosome complex component RRP46